MAQIGTVRLETQNSGTVDVPVFEPGDSASGIYEYVRVQTASGPGFIPVTDPADATYPYLRVQSANDGIVAVTDTPGSAIPDSGIARYKFEQDVLDSWNNNDATDNASAGYRAGQVGDYAKSFDGTDDNVDLNQVLSTNAQDFSVSHWFYVDTLPTSAGERKTIIDEDFTATSTNRIITGLTSSDEYHSLLGGGNIVGPSVSANTWYFGGIDYDHSTGDVEIHLYDTSGLIDRTSDTVTAEDHPIGFVAEHDGTNFYDGAVDDLRFYDKPLTNTEWDNLYNTGSISG